jgi:enamine deaminase RidA (YjgF/YER057c/UK114 family)
VSAIRFTIRGASDVFLVASVRRKMSSRSAATAIYRRLIRELHSRRLTIVQERIFGSLSHVKEILKARSSSFLPSPLSLPPLWTYVEGSPTWGSGLAGVIIRAVRREDLDGPITTLFEGTKPVGRSFHRRKVRHVILQNLQGDLEPVIRRAEKILRREGLSFRQVSRTWFYLDDILRWYGKFNRVRNRIYGRFGILKAGKSRSSGLPASTGIGGRTSSRAPVTLDVVAVTRNAIRGMSNPVQPEAISYESAFSRAVLVQEKDQRLCEISGTAAIGPQGDTLAGGSLKEQSNITLEAIESLLRKEQLALSDASALTVFLKRETKSIPKLIDRLPAVIVKADVCRPELEIEIDGELAVGDVP